MANLFLAVSAESISQTVTDLRALLPLLFLLPACQSKLEDGSGAAPAAPPVKNAEAMHKAGLVLVADLEHASAWEKLIHVDMGVPPSKIDVVAGPGYTTVTIRDLKNRGDAESIAQGLRSYAERNPARYGPTRVEIKLNNTPSTISPFVLPSGGGPLLNPAQDLPTLSLPPLQHGGR